MEGVGGSLGVRKGAWSKVEDDLLTACVLKYGEGKWHLVPPRAGLNRCRKSCRLRWLNYLKPSIKRGEFSEDEVDMMKRLHRLLGNRWSLIAGRLPGRTPNDVKNFWNTNVRKSKVSSRKEEIQYAEPKETVKPHSVIKPQTRTLSKPSPCSLRKWFPSKDQDGTTQCHITQPCAASTECNDNHNNNAKDKWLGTAIGDNGSNLENDKYFSGNQDWTLMKDFNLDEELPTDFLIEDQSWSDFFLDINLWDL